MFAGTNGAGKSSIAGSALRGAGGDYMNPDEAARRILATHPGLTPEEANSRAWHEGVRQLQAAIENRRFHFFETTLGGDTITGLLEEALDAGLPVHVWYVGLRSPELHIARVAARVRKGGHDIPEADIRRRYDNGRRNLIRLLPRLTELLVYDNSEDADPQTGRPPQPLLVLHWRKGRILGPKRLGQTPEWAKPIVAAAMKAAARQTPTRRD